MKLSNKQKHIIQMLILTHENLRNQCKDYTKSYKKDFYEICNLFGIVRTKKHFLIKSWIEVKKGAYNEAKINKENKKRV